MQAESRSQQECWSSRSMQQSKIAPQNVPERRINKGKSLMACRRNSHKLPKRRQSIFHSLETQNYQHSFLVSSWVDLCTLYRIEPKARNQNWKTYIQSSEEKIWTFRVFETWDRTINIESRMGHNKYSGLGLHWLEFLRIIFTNRGRG